MARVTYRAPATHFHRRLVLLGGGALIVVLVLFLQLSRLTIVQGAQLRREAEQVLDRRTYLPTFRGRILDREGRVLAHDQASYEVALSYSVISGSWAVEQAESAARDEVGGIWSELSTAEKQEVVERHLPQFRAREQELLNTMCLLGGITRDELDERLNTIRRNVQRMAAEVWDNQRAAELQRRGDDPATFQFDPQPIREQKVAHVILSDVHDEVAFEFMMIAEDAPTMIEVRDTRSRVNPLSDQVVSLDRDSLPRPLRRDSPRVIHVTGVLDHVLGGVRDQLWKEDVDRRPFIDPKTRNVDLGGYRDGDVIGNAGLERVFEDHLRGLRGVIHERRDTGARSRTEPVPGDDLQLTIDVMLQARVQAILSHEFGLTVVQPWHRNSVLPETFPLNSAAVVLEIETGEALAAVSMPTLAMGESMGDRQRAFDRPACNRAVDAVYPPGSILKPLVLTAAMSEKEYFPGHTITCKGGYYEDRTQPRCWIYREAHHFQSHGPLAGSEAIARSCNVFFYTLADRLEMNRLLDWLEFYGVGQRLHVGLAYDVKTEAGEYITAGEAPGHLPDGADVTKWKAIGEYEFTNLIMGIGQGPMSWTPMHAANAYATLARGGSVRYATIILDDPRADRPQRTPSRPIDAKAVDEALDGLRRSVSEDFGTSNHIRYDDLSVEDIFHAGGVNIWAKTGTAQAPLVDLIQDGTIDEIEKKSRLDHAWCVGLVGPKDSDRPLYAFAVVVEYGGSGGRVAGPIANQIIRALQDLNYLPDDGSRPPQADGRRSTGRDYDLLAIPESESEH